MVGQDAAVEQDAVVQQNTTVEQDGAVGHQVEVPDARMVRQILPPMQSRRGLRSQIRLGKEIP